METKTKVTPELCYQSAVNAAGKILVDDLANQLGIKRAKFMANITEHCILNRVALPDMKLDDAAERAIKRLPKVFERGNVKQAVSMTASRVEAMGLGSYLRFESKPVPAGTSLQIDGVLVDLPLGAILVVPNTEVVAKTETPEANAGDVNEVHLEDPDTVIPEVPTTVTTPEPVVTTPAPSEAVKTLIETMGENPELEKSAGVPVDDQGNVVEPEVASETEDDGEFDLEEPGETQPIEVPSLSALTDALDKVTV